MYELCLELGVPTPETRFFSSREELVAIADSSRYPVVFKGIDTTLAGQETGVRMVIASSRDELLRAHTELDDVHEPRFMVQDYIPGTEDTTWMFNGYFDADSECRIGVCGRKLRQSPPYTGATSLGECLENQTVWETTVTMMKRLGYRGILDIGYRYDERDGQYKLLDANPRLGASFRLFVDSNGLDVLRAMYSDLSGRSPSPRGATVVGRKWLVETSDGASAMVYRRDGLLTARAWLRSLRGVREAAWLARDDPGPTARHYWAAARKLLRLLKHRSA
jgi:predicted ATP-grasp superfamily ATP-dependent carboligase